MSKETIKVPDIGGDSAEVIELLVQPGDTISQEQSLLVLESDKASMEVPAPQAGKLVEWLVKIGDNLSSGDDMAVVEAEGSAAAKADAKDEPAPEPAPEPAEAEATESSTQDAEPAAAEVRGESAERAVTVPDIGTGDAVEVIELLVQPGDTVAEGDSLLVLESDKASMEVPAPFAGEVVAWAVKVGASVREGDALLTLQSEAAVGASKAPAESKPASSPAETKATPAQASVSETPPGAAGKRHAPPPNITEAPPPPPQPAADSVTGGEVYAGPAVRKLAREFGIELDKVKGSGPRGRLVKEDLQAYVQKSLAEPEQRGSGIPPIPAVDFAAFGPVQERPLNRMETVTAANMHRSWLNVPRVTQWDEADITELERFRGDLKAEAERRKVKLTPLPFLFKAAAVALRDNPRFLCSLSSDGTQLVQKDYIHIGMAVDTPAGLVVPVLRDVDRKTLWELAAEIAELAGKARDRKLSPQDMQGGCFSISSLGAIGGQGFTPIVNAPEAGILGVSKAAVKPVWDGQTFVPRTMLPVTLSYDHRVVNGGDAGRFLTQMVSLLSDIRRLLL